MFWKHENATEVISVILKDYFDCILHIDYPSSLASLEVTFSPTLGVIKLESYQIDFYTDLFDYYQAKKDSISNPNPNITFSVQNNGAVYNMTYHDLDLDFYNSSSPYYKGAGYKSDSYLAEADNSHLLYSLSSSHSYDFDQFIDLIADSFRYRMNITDKPEFPITFIASCSGAISDCAKWANGIGYGSIYDYTYDEEDQDYENYENYENYDNYTCVSQNRIEEWPEEYKIQVRKFIETQLSHFNTYTKGWFFWNWKTESAPEWDYQKLREYDLFLHPFDNFTYYKSNGDLKLSDSDNETSTSSVETSFGLSSSSRSSVASSERATTSKPSKESASLSTSIQASKTSSTISTHVSQSTSISSTHSNSTVSSHKNGSYTIKSHSTFASIFVWSLTLMCFAYSTGFLV
ncbi:exoglucanase repeat family protein [Vanderwaltozyma polyspora DSM 70294]|uniref:Exoglucanase repeat family protein n=1 Tax=Vanderwaltozyma polyspora (strain ATCC 22028 / DSM 70294 / BCRC 21397 / CBS 2163 / NBRC 10782 / NRRL Y-8283 / UCD 57-17) TaxID=436907 RepID=A7TQP4_VANPO|nr:exoglucanase repeat family protein [Vanderwaltozyma polyspora DSM 70294]EDO15425.1 exoglucanase repeat family protein [Vanderwaltozyma polyspora DSM 70294]